MYFLLTEFRESCTCHSRCLEQTLLPNERFSFVQISGLVTALSDQIHGDDHVKTRTRHECPKPSLVNTKVLTRGHNCQSEQRKVLHNLEDKRQLDQQGY